MEKINKDISSIYSEAFFDYMTECELKSSFDFTRILIKNFNPASIIDIGCGNGIYLKAFDDLGIKDLIGYDGSKNAIKKALLRGKIHLHNLRYPLYLNKKYDLCLCIEVAEHIENQYSKQLIETLIKLSNTIIFTAATPGQKGSHHINEQPHSFWIELFKEKKFQLISSLTNKIKKEMQDKEVVWWVCKNLMIFKKSEKSK